jgi:hypothetical protein
MNTDDRRWTEHFPIQSVVDLDFVIGQRRPYRVGMERQSPPEFRRRVLAAAISYQLGLSSIDYALKRYVDQETYEDSNASLGDAASDYLRDGAIFLMEELKKLHTVDELTFGVFGAEITLYRIPHALDTARMLSNRGLLLEVLPILRLCLEMMSWAHVAFRMHDEEERIRALKAQNCISMLKQTYKTAGRLYGYLSTFSHWGHVIHRHFIDFDETPVAVLSASVRHRAMALALCLVVLDVLVEVVRQVYGVRSDALILRVQGVVCRDETRRTYQHLSKIAELSDVSELREIQLLLQ